LSGSATSFIAIAPICWEKNSCAGASAKSFSAARAGELKQTQRGKSAAMSTLLVIAGLMGAGGIVLAAMGAHMAPGAGLESAADMLLFHAVAILGGAALIQQGLLWRPLALGVLGAWVLGALLFSGDVTLRAFAGHRLFPMAAPSGGIILIAGWILLAAAAIGALSRS
jgi:uncharacterized membrane protein YgdD (TMEM256/DUF423 family)